MSRRNIRFCGVIRSGTAIEIFGNMIPSLLMLKRDPRAWWRRLKEKGRQKPLPTMEELIQRPDDVGRIGSTYLFIHRWKGDEFDLDAFQRSQDFLADLERLLQAQGRSFRIFTPLSPKTNLPELAEKAQLGNLSPFGLLIHWRFGPRLLITGAEIEGELPVPRKEQTERIGCTDCELCLKICPQEPLRTGEVDLMKCEGCSRCIKCCPIGTG
ncbi:hypothetical protein GJ688_07495 [Heliobacillus mobilis]|uniref:4Fe-4S ferredoxin-type domain-containing protein n=1 Tax=Heliobacterium mobile TaxID=28064 RepID=A0A6I3SIV8_HELMO|nr:hypothetical protein [Heliobacterium mobile]MTV48824.1 hypothetical protein [Heliobacterium mobile]